MANYFTDESPEVRELIEKVVEPLDESVRADYLINCLVLKHRQGMTIKEVFEAELKSMNEFEAEVKGRIEERKIKEALAIFKTKFSEEVKKVSRVDSDSPEYIDIEVEYATDGETESFAFLKEMLTDGSTAEEIARAIA